MSQFAGFLYTGDRGSRALSLGWRQSLLRGLSEAKAPVHGRRHSKITFPRPLARSALAAPSTVTALGILWHQGMTCLARWHKIPKFTEIKPEKNLSHWSFPIGLSRGAPARQTLVPSVRNHPSTDPYLSVGSCNGTELAADQGATDPTCAPTRALGQASASSFTALLCPLLTGVSLPCRDLSWNYIQFIHPEAFVTLHSLTKL